MKAVVKFKKANADALVASYKVYRSNAVAGLFAVGNLIATVTNFAGGDTFTYNDATAQYDTAYYYGVEVVGKDGYSVLSAPIYFNAQKSTGVTSRDIMVGNPKLGFVSYSQTYAFSMMDRVRAVMETCVAEVAAEMGQAITTGENPASTFGAVEAYYEGVPGIYFPSGLSRIAGTGSASSTTAIRNVMTKLKARLSTLEHEGYEYEFRLLGKNEYEALFRHTYQNHISTTTINVPQPVVPVLYASNIYTTTEYLALVTEDTGTTDLYRYVAGTLAGAKQADTAALTHISIPIVFTVKK